MVGASDVKYRKANNSGRGESMSSTDITNASENNYFDHVSESEQNGGHTEYRVFYVIDGHATEKMEDCEIWLSSNNSQTGFSRVEWGIDPIAQCPNWPFHPSVYFPGSNSAVNLGNHASLWSQSLNSFSMTFWIFPNAGGDGFTRYVIDHGGGSNLAFRVWIDSSISTRIIFNIKDAVGVNHQAISDSLELNKWNFVACTFDEGLASDEMKIYINNVLGFQTADTPDVPNLSANLRLSRATDPESMEGYIKDFRFFVNKNLSTSQIDDIYQGEDDAVGASYWLKLTEIVTGIPVDAIGGSLTGTLENGAEFRTSQEIPTTTTSPFGVTWKGATSGPISNSPNLGDLAANGARQCPIWVKWIVEDTDQDAANDYCIFTVQGKIPQGGTPPPPSGGGGDPVPPPTATDFTFAVAGDWGDESMTTTVVNRIKNNSPQPKVVLSVGDCAYDSGSDAVDDWYDRIRPIDTSSIRFETAFGNHDNDESESEENEDALKNRFGYSNTWNMFDYENVRFISIDNTEETTFTSGSTQYNKIKQWLSEGRQDPDIDWIVVYYHKPMFGNSSEHGYNSGNFNQAYFPLFDTYKVDLVCSGHNHHMAQSAQVKYNSGNSTEPTIVDSSSPYVGGAGRIQCISGAGGHDADDLYEMDDGDDIEWVNDTDHGALFVTITNSGSSTTMTGRFKDTDGSTLRTFVINR